MEKQYRGGEKRCVELSEEFLSKTSQCGGVLSLTKHGSKLGTLHMSDGGNEAINVNRCYNENEGSTIPHSLSQSVSQSLCLSVSLSLSDDLVDVSDVVEG